jgi:hypothetical protein
MVCLGNICINTPHKGDNDDDDDNDDNNNNSSMGIYQRTRLTTNYKANTKHKNNRNTQRETLNNYQL